MTNNISHEEKAQLLLQPLVIGDITLKNRVVMAPMTRSRAENIGHIPEEITATYYQQRATAGLIISEATQVTPQGIGYINTPGIHSEEQVEGWKKVTEAVHQEGGKIFLQLWHVGRVSHPDFHNGELPVAPSAIGFEGEAYTPEGMKKVVTPRALKLEEIPGVVEAYRQGAINAKKAGFDGVEIHGANGYLIDQFLQDVSNHRDDQYGGSVENRARFLLEVTNAVISVWGSKKVGVRLSPSGLIAGMGDSNPQKTFGYAVQELDKLDLAYLHLMEPFFKSEHYPQMITPVLDYFRPLYSGNLMINGGFTFEKAYESINNQKVDLVSFGNPFISNPDLVNRFKHNYPLAEGDKTTYYSGGAKGYIDYPVYSG